MTSIEKLVQDAPPAPFIDDIGAHMTGKVVDDELAKLQNRLQGYKMIESRLQQERLRLSAKMPDLARSLDMIELLINKSDGLKVDFEITDHVYAKASVEGAESVMLWLGANVMLEYPLEEARALLAEQKDKCAALIEDARTKTQWIKDQITTTEVTLARIFNWDVEQRRAKA